MASHPQLVVNRFLQVLLNPLPGVQLCTRKRTSWMKVWKTSRKYWNWTRPMWKRRRPRWGWHQKFRNATSASRRKWWVSWRTWAIWFCGHLGCRRKTSKCNRIRRPDPTLLILRVENSVSANFEVLWYAMGECANFWIKSLLVQSGWMCLCVYFKAFDGVKIWTSRTKPNCL